VTNSTTTRIGVVGGTASGRVYERVYANGSWSWADLSTYRLILQPINP
jgi:hypothetical protein